MQTLFQGGAAFSIVPGKKSMPKATTVVSKEPFGSKSFFDCLNMEEDKPEREKDSSEKEIVCENGDVQVKDSRTQVNISNFGEEQAVERHAKEAKA